jgi:PIN domain nuclease of toxin-antitoxin system
MKHLIDTHVFLWYLSGDKRLTNQQRSVWEDISTEKVISIVSIWEMAVKSSTGKLKLALPLEQFVRKHFEKVGIQLYHVSLEASYAVSLLPYFHRDPFDRLIIAQALHMQIPVLTHDKIFRDYGVKVI